DAAAVRHGARHLAARHRRLSGARAHREVVAVMAVKERTAIWPWKGDVPPHLPRANEMPKAFLLPGDPGRVDKAGEVLENFRIVGQNREFRMGVGTLEDVPVGVCSTGIGGASTEIVMVELAALGVEVAIRTG